MLVLTGAGDTFCAGADISALRESADGSPGLTSGVTVEAEEALAAFPRPSAGGGARLLRGRRQPARGRLRPAVRGGGASFGVTPANLGIVYSASSTRRLVALVGPGTAKHLLFSGELIGTERALRTGLVDEVLPPGGLDKRVEEYVRLLASRSQLTQAAAKEFAAGLDGPRDAHWAAEARGSTDTAEGVAAFLERRAPRFTYTTAPTR